MKQGRSFELLVERLERQLSNDPNILIETPKRLRDFQTCKLREHDVVITVNYSHHRVMIGIECRDRSRPVGVNHVEAFESKCRNTGISKGIIVSASGFYSTAMKKAQKMGIRCIELKDIEHVNFLDTDAVVVQYTKVFTQASYTPVLVKDPISTLEKYEIYDSNGRLVTNEQIKANLIQFQDSFPWCEAGKELTRTIIFKTHGFTLINSVDGEKIPMDALQVLVTYHCQHEEIEFASKSYTDLKKGETLAELAVAPLTIDGGKKQLVLIGSKDGTTVQVLPK
ncbi:MAG: restriction endonuclease [Candidatus Thiodiazotropha endolucinida]